MKWKIDCILFGHFLAYPRSTYILVQERGALPSVSNYHLLEKSCFFWELKPTGNMVLGCQSRENFTLSTGFHLSLKDSGLRLSKYNPLLLQKNRYLGFFFELFITRSYSNRKQCAHSFHCSERKTTR